MLYLWMLGLQGFQLHGDYLAGLGIASLHDFPKGARA